jgi:hypothetical protein
VLLSPSCSFCLRAGTIVLGFVSSSFPPSLLLLVVPVEGGLNLDAEAVLDLRTREPRRMLQKPFPAVRSFLNIYTHRIASRDQNFKIIILKTGNLPFANSQRQAENRSQPFVRTHLGTMATSEKSQFLSALFRAQRKSKNLSKLEAATCTGQSICARISMSCSVQKLGSRRNTNLKPAKRTTLSCPHER